MAESLPTIITVDGLLPQTPAALNAQILAGAAALSPGITANLPGIMIEDITSTDTAALVQIDSARVETVDSLTPYACNAYLLVELGNIYGVQQGAASLTSVGVIFSSTSPGYAISVGTLVSDGIYQYSVVDGGIIQSNGQSAILTCIALLPGIWSIPSGTVTELATSIPTIYNVTCSNPFPGTPGQPPETESEYRGEVLQAGLAASTGMPRFVKTVVARVAGVQKRLISMQQNPGGGWKILVGGGDIYAVAYAIWRSVLDVSTLVGSQMLISNITRAAGPVGGVVTTSLNHGYPNGQIVTAEQVGGMTPINGIPMTVTVIDEKTFSSGVDTSAMPAYTAGGILTPNLRNNFVAIQNYPDVYQVVFVSPPLQTVTISLLWGTSATNFVNDSVVAQLGAPALATYVNSIYAGQPMNLYELQTTFQAAIASVLSPQLLTRMVFAVSINGVGVSPEAGTGIIAGDPESYFSTDPMGTDMTILPG